MQDLGVNHGSQRASLPPELLALLNPLGHQGQDRPDMQAARAPSAAVICVAIPVILGVGAAIAAGLGAGAGSIMGIGAKTGMKLLGYQALISIPVGFGVGVSTGIFFSCMRGSPQEAQNKDKGKMTFISFFASTLIAIHYAGKWATNADWTVGKSFKWIGSNMLLSVAVGALVGIIVGVVFACLKPGNLAHVAVPNAASNDFQPFTGEGHRINSTAAKDVETEEVD
ncbi:hypothetical protein SCG7109_AC_00410 [Chlamydiales bacterium SCGC AG-110-M15]|nr:hypothetical protein SCG7109_AC_00410 [Chlamydiales bacterium SCGC AG-110-M15]